MTHSSAKLPNLLLQITDDLSAQLSNLSFGPPVSHVYNPLIYARAGFQRYLEHCATGSKQVLLVGMNPGPWGMAQTGVPFGDPVCVKSWLKIEAFIDRPPTIHPNRPVAGFDSRRREVSGQRVWGWAQKRFGTPARFFASFLVINYCPLVFMETSGRNRTPDKLPVAERKPLLDACDHALRQTATRLDAHWVIGIGNFAAQSVARALAGSGCHTGRITHPSPANPKANRGWATLIEQELTTMGLVDLLPNANI